MRIAVMGRDRVLLEAAERLFRLGHEIVFVFTGRSEAYYTASEDDYAEFARRAGAEFTKSAKLNDAQVRDRFQTNPCDLGISINWPVVISSETLSLFPKGVLNVHAGDLPRYRGNACPNWAILNDEKQIGYCVHFMVPELDAGPVIARAFFPLTEDTYITDVYNWINLVGPELLVDSVQRVAKAGIEAVPQPDDDAAVLRAFPRRPEDSQINWRDQARAIHRLIRASSRPFEGAFSFLEGRRKLIIWRADLHQVPWRYSAIPGQVCGDADGDPVICCGDGILRLKDICLEGASSCEASKKELLSSLRNRLIYSAEFAGDYKRF